MGDAHGTCSTGALACATGTAEAGEPRRIVVCVGVAAGSRHGKAGIQHANAIGRTHLFREPPLPARQIEQSTRRLSPCRRATGCFSSVYPIRRAIRNVLRANGKLGGQGSSADLNFPFSDNSLTAFR